jgi:hypothetical protein
MTSSCAVARAGITPAIAHNISNAKKTANFPQEALVAFIVIPGPSP